MPTIPYRNKIGARTFVADVPAADDEGKLYANPDDVIAVERQIAVLLALEGPVSGDAFAFIRQVAQLEAQHLAKLLDVSAGTISRWENGVRPVDRAAWLVLGSIVLHKVGVDDDVVKRAVRLERKPAKETRVSV